MPGRGSVLSKLHVPAGVRIRQPHVTVSISHPFDSDLRIAVIAPTGKTVVLADAMGTWGDDFSGTTFSDGANTSIVSALPPFAGRYRPVEPLTDLSGSPRGGTWKLKVTDLRGRYAGRLNTWRLELSDCAGTRHRAHAGAPTPPSLPQGVPTGHERVEGRLITVTNRTQGVDGDASSVAALQANPGPDGLSLIEAMTATNNDPGSYTIRFDKSLDGATITITNELPVLRGGHVLIDGDIDGDGRPDVTLADPDDVVGWAFNIASSGNRLHALVLRGFGNPVVFTTMKTDKWGSPMLKKRTFARNIVSGLVLRRPKGAPVSIQPTLGHEECDQSPCRTESRWLDTRIVGTTIDSSRNGGIGVGWANDDGDIMRRVTVAGNRIHLGTRPAFGLEGVGLNLAVGIGAGASDDVIADAVAAYNSIEIQDGKAIQVLAGQRGRSGNAVKRVRVIGNRVRFPDPRPATEAVSIFVSDDCWPPGHSVCRNKVRRIDVVGNVLTGAYVGVRVAEPCCATFPSTVRHVRIEGNVIRSVISAPTEFEAPWGVAMGGTGPAVSDVRVTSNTIEQTLATTRNYGAFLTAGGIALLGGLGKENATIRDISVAYNRVTTKLTGILLLGGGPDGTRRPDDATGNRVARVSIRGNVVTRVPRLARHWDARIKGISMIGGVAGPARPDSGWSATTNTVECVHARHNLVVGERNDIAVLPNVGAGALQNTARFGGC